MTDMTDETEAVARAIANTTDFDGDRMASRYHDGELRDLAQAAIAALDKLRIKRAGELLLPYKDGPLGSVRIYLDEVRAICGAAATIATLRAEIERARAVIAEIAEFCANTGKGNPIVDERIIDRVEEAAVEYLRALSAEAIAKGKSA